MTTVNSTSGTGPSQALLDAVNPKAATTPADSVEADTNKFMTLLVTQLKNQDPMSPMDNAQLTSQLAQLSTVTGVNKLNTTLESLKGSYQSAQSLQAATMIGHGVLTSGSSMNLQNSNAVFGVELGSPADNVQVSVLNASGKVIHTMNLGAQQPGVIPLTWDGGTDGIDGGTGPLAADGRYTFQVSASRAGDKLKDANPLAFGTIASVSTSAKDGVKLNVPSVGMITMDDVKQIL
jgi:flagellar basal-body rod modification protein FlgD